LAQDSQGSCKYVSASYYYNIGGGVISITYEIRIPKMDYFYLQQYFPADVSQDFMDFKKSPEYFRGRRYLP